MQEHWAEPIRPRQSRGSASPAPACGHSSQIRTRRKIEKRKQTASPVSRRLRYVNGKQGRARRRRRRREKGKQRRPCLWKPQQRRRARPPCNARTSEQLTFWSAPAACSATPSRTGIYASCSVVGSHLRWVMPPPVLSEGMARAAARGGERQDDKAIPGGSMRMLPTLVVDWKEREERERQ